MNLLEAIVLGLIQGLTEFLPVSSSGHLELGKYLFGIDHEANFYFSIAVHGATVLSTLFVLWKEIAGLVKGFFTFKLNNETRYIIKLFISMIPVGIAGLFMTEIAEKYFAGNMISLSIEFFISALFLGLTLLIKPKEREMTYFDSFIIGIAQALAVLPGISRSGATISTGMMLGNKKSDIAKFSFLMVLIPIIGANFLELISGDFTKEGTSVIVILAGFITAFISGYLACRWMISIVKKGSLKWFALYCVLVGIYSLLLGLHVF
ncbi:MAG TPA: UDP-diphosphatase [Bacteroidales bacterium]|nr:UDP-diphosphatase [Bacteroidales bacterium]HBZ22284.1 UDP-diphosphatase [Bacteroidales bacterium]